MFQRSNYKNIDFHKNKGPDNYLKAISYLSIYICYSYISIKSPMSIYITIMTDLKKLKKNLPISNILCVLYHAIAKVASTH